MPLCVFWHGVECGEKRRNGGWIERRRKSCGWRGKLREGEGMLTREAEEWRE